MMCPRCGGILLGGMPPAGTAILQVNGKDYHVYCGYKEQERLKEERAKLREEAHKARQPYDFDDYGSARKF